MPNLSIEITSSEKAWIEIEAARQSRRTGHKVSMSDIVREALKQLKDSRTRGGKIHE